MKKTVAVVLSLLLIISLLPMAAFAGSKTDEVTARMEAARDFLYGEKTSFSAAEGLDFMFFLKADGDGSAFKDDYVQSVKDAFDAGTMNTADRVAIAMSCLQMLGVDTEAFELNDSSKVNLEDKMKENGTNVDSPYNYLYVLEQSSDDAYTQQVLDTLAAGYTPGSGYDYWGFSTDNTANFAVINNYGGGDDALTKDAKNIVESAKTDKGYYYYAPYGTDANGNSTAAALFFYAMSGDQEDADEAYAFLIDNFDTGNGSYAYELGGAANNYATRDVLKALIEYKALNEYLDSINEVDDPVDEGEDVDAPAAGTDEQTSPATGDSLAALGVAGIAISALGITLVLRKKKD